MVQILVLLQHILELSPGKHTQQKSRSITERRGSKSRGTNLVFFIDKQCN